VVTSTASCLPEVAGDAALLVDPYHVEALAGALARAVGDDALRADLIAKGFARARQFRWEQSAQKLLGLYHQIADYSPQSGA
jgi:glycosyltransferase involved in cell wall biosynthesis